MWRDGRCPICEGKELVEFAQVKNVPASAGQLCPTRDAAVRAATGDVHLAICRSCGYIGNRAFDPARLSFGPTYDASLHYSPVYRQFLDDLAAQLIQRYDLRGRTVVEVACGKGYFLRHLAELGIGRGIGIDLSPPKEGVEQIGGATVEFIRDYYTDAYAGLGADLVCCRHALQEIVRPRDLVATVGRSLGAAHGRAAYFEVPNGADIFAEPAPWRLLYEYGSFFTPESLEALFTTCGFRTLRVGPCYVGGQYLAIEAAPTTESRGGAPQSGVSDGRLRALQDFGVGIRRTLASWERRLEDLAARGRRVALWGAGGRGLNFLNTVAAARTVPCVVDINPSRQGAFVPGSGQQVVAPDALRDYRPDVVIVSNGTYLGEIEQQVTDLGLKCEFLVV